MAALKTLFFSSLVLLIASPVFAGNGHRGGGGSRAAVGSAPRSGGGAAFSRSGSRFAGINRASSGNFRRWNAASTLQRNGNRNWANNRIGNGNRNWNGNRHGNNWNANRHRGNGNWRHRCGNRIVFIGGFGYPWYYYPYSYYPYAYGGYEAAYAPSTYDPGQVYSGDGDEGYYEQPVDGKDVGSNGSVVIEVQRRLAREGFYQGTIDGQLGSRTFYAIRAYQRAHNLRVDGQIGRQILSSMGLG